jgi:hypothetical protein
MGRAKVARLVFPVFLFILTLLLLSVFPASSFKLKISYHGELEEYYTEGEYILFITTIEPKSKVEGRKLDGIEYDIVSGLQDCGIIIEINLTSGKSIFHPTPDDYYERDNVTELRFYLPDGGTVGVDKITVKVYGYVPEIVQRLKNVTVISVTAGEEKIVEKNVTVVNKAKFYKDIKRLRDELCDEADSIKLDEALSLYRDEKFKEADEKIHEVELSVAECKVQERKKELEDEINQIGKRLSDLKKDLTILEVKMEVNRDKIENYTDLYVQLMNLASTQKDIEKLLDQAAEKIYEDKLDEAKEKITLAEEATLELEKNVTKFSVKLERYISSKQFDWTWIAVVVSVVVVGIIIFLYVRGTREKW